MIAINVAQLLKLPPGTVRDLDFSEPLPELRPEFDLVGPVEGQAHLIRTSRGIFVSTCYQTTLRQACGRCLADVDELIEGSSDDEFMPIVDVVTGVALPEQPESDELAIDQQHMLDLTEVIRQDLLTRLPLRPLCETNCPGLCPECGEDLKSGQCLCDRGAAPGSPFAVLAELLGSETARDLSSN